MVQGVREMKKETNTSLLEPTALPLPSQTQPMPHEDFDALVRATRWTAISPFLDPDGEGPLTRFPIAAPFHGASPPAGCTSSSCWKRVRARNDGPSLQGEVTG